MINGVSIKKLKVIPDERGRLMEILRSDDKVFKKFGQAYMTTTYPGVVKAWHWHKKQDDNFTCVHGKIKLALYDARKKSQTYKKITEFILSTEDPILVTIPKMVYHGFKGMADYESIVINIPTLPYNYKKPDEFRIDPYDNDIDYDWRK